METLWSFLSVNPTASKRPVTKLKTCIVLSFLHDKKKDSSSVRWSKDDINICMLALGFDAQLSSQHEIWVQAVSAMDRNTLLAGRGSLDLCVQNRESLHSGCIPILLK